MLNIFKHFLLFFFSLALSFQITLASDCYELMHDLFRKSTVELQSYQLNSDLFRDIYLKLLKDTPTERLNEINNDLIDKVSKLNVSREFSRLELISYFDKFKEYPVVKDTLLPVNEGFYDRPCFFGFCFGRAMVAERDLIKNHQFQKNDFYKAWFVGEFNNGNWNHHVVTIVKSEGEWFVLEPFLEEVMTLKDYKKNFIDPILTRGVFIPTPSDRLLYLKDPKSDLYPSSTDVQWLEKVEDQPEMGIMWTSFFRDATKDL